MAKYTPEYKLEIVKKVLDDGWSAGAVAREYQVNKGQIQTWVASYQSHGMSGLEKKRARYTGEFKQKVVEDMHKNKMSLRETAAKYNLGHHTVVSKWERVYLEEGPEGLYKERRGRGNTGRPVKLDKKVEEDLIAEVQRLRAENDYLKKLNALVQKRERRERGLK